MKDLSAQPSLYQINTRVWLTELSRGLGRAATQQAMAIIGELQRIAVQSILLLLYCSLALFAVPDQR